jgi:hypothetical protein
MKNKKQTAVEWIVKEFNLESFHGAVNLALSLEKEQIINAYDSGTFYLEGEDYFRKTYENESEEYFKKNI